MTVARAVRPCGIVALAVLCAGLIAMIPAKLTTPSLPKIGVTAIDLTAADVPTFDYIFGTEIPELWSTVTSTYQEQFADLSDIWSAGLSGLNWTDGGESINALNQEVLDWINNINVIGLNFIEDMDGNPIDGYDPSLCNIVFNVAAAGNAWLDELNDGAVASMAGLNQGLANFFDGLSDWAVALSEGL